MTRGRRFFTGTFVRVPRRRRYFAGTFIRVLGGGVFSAGTFVRVLKVGGIRRHVNCSLWPSFLRRHVRAGTSEPAPGTGTVDKCSQRGNGGNEAEAS